MLADLVKFAKERPVPAENEQSMENSVTFVLQTKQASLPEYEEGGKENV